MEKKTSRFVEAMSRKKKFRIIVSKDKSMVIHLHRTGFLFVSFFGWKMKYANLGFIFSSK